MKKLFALFCACIPLVSFCQSSELIDSVNETIGPEYVIEIDSLPTYHKYNLCSEARLVATGDKNIIAVASNADSNAELNKIFILARTDDDLEVIDSSAAFDIGYLGPHIEVKGNNLTVIHNFDKGFCSLTFHFNSRLHKYILSKANYSITEPNYPDYDHTVNLEQAYNVQDQTLTLKSYLHNNNNNNIDKKMTNVVFHKLPPGTSLRLSAMKDPYDYDVFLTEGNVYDRMMNY